MCGAASDDPRVQSSIQEIFQIVETVKKPARRVVCIQLFAPYFIVSYYSILSSYPTLEYSPRISGRCMRSHRGTSRISPAKAGRLVQVKKLANQRDHFCPHTRSYVAWSGGWWPTSQVVRLHTLTRDCTSGFNIIHCLILCNHLYISYGFNV
jgi:hypothetical protein